MSNNDLLIQLINIFNRNFQKEKEALIAITQSFVGISKALYNLKQAFKPVVLGYLNKDSN